VSETSIRYLLKPEANGATMSTEFDAMRAELEELERRLIPLLVTVQRALGKEPSVLTPEQRRRMAVERRTG
jgi:hypothetical protein